MQTIRKEAKAPQGRSIDYKGDQTMTKDSKEVYIITVGDRSYLPTTTYTVIGYGQAKNCIQDAVEQYTEAYIETPEGNKEDEFTVVKHSELYYEAFNDSQEITIEAIPAMPNEPIGECVECNKEITPENLGTIDHWGMWCQDCL